VDEERWNLPPPLPLVAARVSLMDVDP